MLLVDAVLNNVFTRPFCEVLGLARLLRGKDDTQADIGSPTREYTREDVERCSPRSVRVASLGVGVILLWGVTLAACLEQMMGLQVFWLDRHHRLSVSYLCLVQLQRHRCF